jgi:hypothetical protein
VTEHLRRFGGPVPRPGSAARFGGIEIDRGLYRRALPVNARFG